MTDAIERTLSMVGELGGAGILVAVAVGVVLLSIRVIASWRGPRPDPGEVWFAEVPFADGSGSKDRPVLVLSRQGRACAVARFTSRDRSARRDYRRVPAQPPGLRGVSWADLRPITLRCRAFRRQVARADAALLLWYERESRR